MQKKILGHPRIQVSKDGTTLLALDIVYDLTDKRNDIAPLATLNWEEEAKQYPYAIAISPDGRYVVTTHIGLVRDKNGRWIQITETQINYDPPPEPENLILVWDTSTGNVVYQDSFTMVYKTPSRWQAVDNNSEYIHVEFLNNDKFVTVSESGEVAVWSIPLKKRIYALSAAALEASLFAINNVQDQFVILEGNPYLLSDGCIGQQIVYSTKSGQVVRRINAPVAFNGEFEPLKAENTLRFWTLADGRLIKEVEKPESGVILSAHFSPDDNLLAMNDHLTIYLLDIESGILIDRLPIPCNLIGFTDDGQNLVVHKDNQVKIWNIQQERFYKNFAFSGEIYYTQMVNNHRVVVVTNENKESIVYLVDIGALLS